MSHQIQSYNLERITPPSGYCCNGCVSVTARAGQRAGNCIPHGIRIEVAIADEV